jgi:hypothetical protein
MDPVARRAPKPDSPRQRAAFDAYVKLGSERSIERLHRELVASPGAHGMRKAPGLRTLYSWSSQRRWQLRLATIEAEAQERARAEQLAEFAETTKRDIQISRAVIAKNLAMLKNMPDNAGSPASVMNALAQAMRFERNARIEAINGLAHTDPYREALEELNDRHLLELAIAAQRVVERERTQKS